MGKEISWEAASRRFSMQVGRFTRFVLRQCAMQANSKGSFNGGRSLLGNYFTVQAVPDSGAGRAAVHWGGACYLCCASCHSPQPDLIGCTRAGPHD